MIGQKRKFNDDDHDGESYWSNFHNESLGDCAAADGDDNDDSDLATRRSVPVAILSSQPACHLIAVTLAAEPPQPH